MDLGFGTSKFTDSPLCAQIVIMVGIAERLSGFFTILHKKNFIDYGNEIKMLKKKIIFGTILLSVFITYLGV